MTLKGDNRKLDRYLLVRGLVMKGSMLVLVMLSYGIAWMIEPVRDPVLIEVRSIKIILAYFLLQYFLLPVLQYIYPSLDSE